MSSNHRFLNEQGFCLLRRRFVQGLALGGAAAHLGFGSPALLAETMQAPKRHTPVIRALHL